VPTTPPNGGPPVPDLAWYDVILIGSSAKEGAQLMAIDVLEMYSADCDRCEGVDECGRDHLTLEDAIDCVISDGWAEIDGDPEGVLCPGCQEKQEHEETLWYPPAERRRWLAIARLGKASGRRGDTSSVRHDEQGT
jgi:hypothetical protein